jgi:hypothetical protein
MKKLLTSTEGGKTGAIDGLNIFFGALLGANLGTLEKMPVFDYVKLIFLLAATVMALRMVSTSERRKTMLVTVGIYALLIVGMLGLPGLQPKGMDAGDLQRLVATLVVWIVFVVASELSPIEKKAEQSPSA